MDWVVFSIKISPLLYIYPAAKEIGAYTAKKKGFRKGFQRVFWG